jgi:hypothetical protein
MQRLAVLAWFLVGIPVTAAAQRPPADVFVPPIAGEWEPIRSLGQPSRWNPYVGVGFGVDAPFGRGPVGITGVAGVYRDITNPVVALFGVAGEAYAGQRGERVDAGARLQLVSPAFYLRGGVDWNARIGRVDVALGLTVPPTRGGWFGHGGQIRIDYVPARDHAVGAAPPQTRQAQADTGLLAAMRWITLLQTFAWRMDDGPLSHDAATQHARTALAGLADEIAVRTPADRGRSVYDVVLTQYHDALAAAFAIGGVHANGDVATRTGDEARRIVLEEVVLP